MVNNILLMDLGYLLEDHSFIGFQRTVGSHNIRVYAAADSGMSFSTT